MKNVSIKKKKSYSSLFLKWPYVIISGDGKIAINKSITEIMCHLFLWQFVLLFLLNNNTKE